MKNTDKLIELVDTNPTAKEVFGYLKHRKETNGRHRGDTDLLRLVSILNKSGIKVGTVDVVNVFTTLQEEGFGKVLSKAGNPTKFHWDINPLQLAQEIADTTPHNRRKEDKGVKSTPILETSSGPIVIQVGENQITVDNVGTAAAILKALG